MASSSGLSQDDSSSSAAMPENTLFNPHSSEELHYDTNVTSKLQQSQRHPSLNSQTTAKGHGNSLTNNPKSNLSGTATERVSTSHSMSSRLTRNSTNTRNENVAANRAVRTLPPWIDSYEAEGEPPPSRATDRLMAPSPVHSATHHFGSTPTVTAPATPSQNKRVSHDGWVDDDDAETSTLPAERTPERNLFGTIQKTERGRRWDHVRSGAPIILQQDYNARSSWIPFIKSSMYGPAPNEEGKRVDPEFLRELTPGYEKPWVGDLEGGDADNLLHHKERRRVWYKRAQHTLLTHPLVPLAFRLTTLLTSIIALSIAARIFHLSNSRHVPQNPSTVMAVVVDVVAMPYVLYITWDEYTGKPLGLRSPKAKMRLVLLDLFFIIFESANASLAFDALTDQNGVCAKGGDRGVCGRQAALGAILLLALIAWLMTFSVSIFRLVERVGAREGDD